MAQEAMGRLGVTLGTRVSAEFARALREEADKRSINLAALTRRLLEERLRAWREESATILRDV